MSTQTSLKFPYVFSVARSSGGVATRYTSGFVDDVIIAHTRPGKGDASGAYTQRQSLGGSARPEIVFGIVIAIN